MSDRDFKLVDRVTFILERCKGRRVLHLGCTNHPYTSEAVSDGSLLHLRLREVAEDLHGFDSDMEGIDTLGSLGFDNLHQVDLEQLEAAPLDKTFDVIVAGEVIEHLSNPGLFLKGIRRFMTDDSELVLTTVNAYSAMRFIQYALRGKGGEAEPVHPDHVAYYSYRTLTVALQRAGFSLAEFAYYDLGPEHRPYCPWYYRSVNDIAVALSRQLADGVIAVCHSDSSGEIRRCEQ